MEILGYSERGMINALMYSICFSQERLKSISEFLGLVKGVSCNNLIFGKNIISQSKGDISDVTIFIEQSFSDFGDADLVILTNCEDKPDDNYNKGRSVWFFEAKVKTYRRRTWSLKSEIKDFKDNLDWLDDFGKRKKGYSLFEQLLLKFFLWKGLEKGKIKVTRKDGKLAVLGDRIDCGEYFRARGSTYRKIGENGVVLNAVEKLQDCISEGFNRVFFVGIVPEISENIGGNHGAGKNENENKSLPQRFANSLREKWLTEKEFENFFFNLGFIKWGDIENNFLGKSPILKENFKWNRGQIY